MAESIKFDKFVDTTGVYDKRSNMTQAEFNQNPLVDSLTIFGEADFPIKIIERWDEDYKGIHVLDKNRTLRYQLLFAAGHLYFTSWDSNGNNIVSQTQIV